MPRGCCNKVPQTGWIRTTEIYCLTVLAVGSLKSMCQQVGAFRGGEEESVPLLSQVLVASGVPWLIGGLLPVSLRHLTSICLCVQIPPFIRTRSSWMRAHPHDLILTQSSAETQFPNKITFTGPGGLRLHRLSGGHNSTHNTTQTREIVHKISGVMNPLRFI